MQLYHWDTIVSYILKQQGHISLCKLPYGGNGVHLHTLFPFTTVPKILFQGREDDEELALQEAEDTWMCMEGQSTAINATNE